MVKAIAEFLVGAAVILTPQYQVPLLLGTAAVKVGSSIVKQRKKAEDSEQAVDSNGEFTSQQLVLTWDDLSVALPSKKGKEAVPIFKDLQGSARPGRLLAIMGSSGAGKTTLLNCLAGQLPYNKGTIYTGNITINGVRQADSKHHQAYIKQDDVFYSQLTVRETLTTAAQLRLGPSVSFGEVEKVVTSLIEKLGLTKAANTVVGNAKVRGLSGGERKRLSIACELLGDPSLLFCDEPTTGLDSFQAEQVMKGLKDLAGEGKTVIVAIHQPRSSIFGLFDDLILVSEGGMVYSGPASEAVKHFREQGHECPPNYNPAEFLADLISVDQSTPDASKSSKLRVEKLKTALPSKPNETQPEAKSASVSKNGHAAPSQKKSSRGRGLAKWGLQGRVLLQRSWRQIKRDKATNVARVMSNVSSAIIFGSIYWRMGKKQIAVQNRMGLLQVAAINCAMSSVVKTLGVFSQERVIVERERSKGCYDVAPYFGAKLAAESPIGAVFPLLFGALLYPTTGLHPRLSRFAKFLGILTLESFVSSSVGLAVGSVAPSPDAAQAIGPAVMVIFIVFGGYYVNSSGVPRVLRWLPRASLIKHAFEALCVNEFRGLQFEASEPKAAGDARTGEQVLQRLSFEDSKVSRAMASEARILLFNYWFTYCVLRARRPSFQQLQPPEKQ